MQDFVASMAAYIFFYTKWLKFTNTVGVLGVLILHVVQYKKLYCSLVKLFQDEEQEEQEDYSWSSWRMR